MAELWAAVKTAQMLRTKVTQRNKQIREMRCRLAELADELGDAAMVPPLSHGLSQWIAAEVKKR